MKQNIVFLDNEQTKLKADVEYISEHLMKLSGVPINLNGFKLLLDNGEIYGVYNNHKFLYRKFSETEYILSDNGTVWEESIEIEVQEPTINELKKSKIQEMSDECQKKIYNGVDIDLSIGKEHFSLTVQDQLNLSNKKDELNTKKDKFEYHADGKLFTYFSKEDMTKIIEESENFVLYNTAYYNSLAKWIMSISNKEKISSIKYGDSVPVMYQSEVFKNFSIEMKNNFNKK